MSAELGAEQIMRPYLDRADESSWGSQGSTYESDLLAALNKALELLGVEP